MKYANIKAGVTLSAFLSQELHCPPARLYHKSRYGPAFAATVNSTDYKDPKHIWNRVRSTGTLSLPSLIDSRRSSPLHLLSLQRPYVPMDPIARALPEVQAAIAAAHTRKDDLRRKFLLSLDYTQLLRRSGLSTRADVGSYGHGEAAPALPAGRFKFAHTSPNFSSPSSAPASADVSVSQGSESDHSYPAESSGSSRTGGCHRDGDGFLRPLRDATVNRNVHTGAHGRAPNSAGLPLRRVEKNLNHFTPMIMMSESPLGLTKPWLEEAAKLLCYGKLESAHRCHGDPTHYLVLFIDYSYNWHIQLMSGDASV